MFAELLSGTLSEGLSLTRLISFYSVAIVAIAKSRSSIVRLLRTVSIEYTLALVRGAV